MNKVYIEYCIFYERYDSDDNDLKKVGFSTLEAMEECLKSMREQNKIRLTYLNIVCKKITLERLDI